MLEKRSRVWAVTSLCCALGVLSACDKRSSPPASPNRSGMSPPTMNARTMAAPRPTPARRTGTKPPRVIEPIADLVKNPNDYTFVTFGDIRSHHSRCNHPANPTPAVPTPAIVARFRYTGAAPWLLPHLTKVMRKRPPGYRPPPTEPAFTMFSGDFTYRGSCVKDWRHFQKTFLAKIDVRRIFPVLGNHDLWHKYGERAPMPLFFKTFPFLRPPRPKHAGDGWHHYAVRVGPALFIGLCSGSYPADGGRPEFWEADQSFNCVQSNYAKQMAWMKQVLAWGAKGGVRWVFVQYHKPSFSCYSHPPLRTKEDPVVAMRAFAKQNPSMKLIAISGHNHTTELYQAGPVMVLTAGGAGAPQHAPASRRYCHKTKVQPREMFWKDRKLWHPRFNYFEVRVTPKTIAFQERCLAYRGGKLVLEAGSRITADGKVTHRPGACTLMWDRR